MPQKSNAPILYVKVARVRDEATNIKSFELVSIDSKVLPAFTAGAHIGIHLPNGIRQYSLCNDPQERNRYLIGVQKEEAGRGGSKLIHEKLVAGKMLKITAPRNHFPLADSGDHILLAGGIGITPMLSMASELARRNQAFRLWVFTRAPERTPFRERLAELAQAGMATVHHDGGDKAKSFDVGGLLADFAPGRHMYCCGPQGFINTVHQATAHWPAKNRHFESFMPAAPQGNASSFKVIGARSGVTLVVPPDQSMLKTMLEGGIDTDFACENGTCGACKVRYLAGEPEHRDMVLTEEEKKHYLMPCVSRAKGDSLVLDL
jgi:vanillate O-demethylase ferredoxin subunit